MAKFVNMYLGTYEWKRFRRIYSTHELLFEFHSDIGNSVDLLFIVKYR